MIYDGRQQWDVDDEYEAQMESARERELARRNGMNAFEASNYTRDQLQAKLQEQPVKVTQGAPSRGRTINVSFDLPDGRRWSIWDADADITPAGLRGVNNQQ